MANSGMQDPFARLDADREAMRPNFEGRPAVVETVEEFENEPRMHEHVVVAPARGWPDDLGVRKWNGSEWVPLSDEKIDSIVQEDVELDARRLQQQRDRERRDREFSEAVERRVQEDMIRAEVISRLPADVRALLYPRQSTTHGGNNSGSAGGSGDGIIPVLAVAAAADLWRALT